MPKCGGVLINVVKIIYTVAFILVLALPGVVAEPNPEQSGYNSICDDRFLYSAGLGIRPLAPVIDLEPGTHFTVSQSGGVAMVITFYEADGTAIFGIYYSGSDGSDKVPRFAAYGTMCVLAIETVLTVPAVGATWTYQDGF